MCLVDPMKRIKIQSTNIRDAAKDANAGSSRTTAVWQDRARHRHHAAQRVAVPWQSLWTTGCVLSWAWCRYALLWRHFFLDLIYIYIIYTHIFRLSFWNELILGKATFQLLIRRDRIWGTTCLWWTSSCPLSRRWGMLCQWYLKWHTLILWNWKSEVLQRVEVLRGKSTQNCEDIYDTVLVTSLPTDPSVLVLSHPRWVPCGNRCRRCSAFCLTWWMQSWCWEPSRLDRTPAEEKIHVAYGWLLSGWGL